MRLVEKKCPNCGANLEFGEKDKSCKCNYCHRAYEIERDESLNVGDIAEQFNLSEFKGPLKTIGIIHIVITIFIFLIAFGVFGSIAFGFFKTQKKISSEFDEGSIISKDSNKKDEKKYISDINELTNDDYEDIDNDASSHINHIGEGVNDAHHSYSMDGNLHREKTYVASKKDDSGNVIVSIYKAYYKDFFNQTNRYTVYIPIVYENIKLNDFDKFKNPQVKAPEFYFNSEKTSYTYGYGSIEQAEEGIIKPLEADYKVSSK